MRRAPLTLALALAALAGCEGDEAEVDAGAPDGSVDAGADAEVPPFAIEEVPATPVSAAFTVDVDLAHPAFDGPLVQPQQAPVTVSPAPDGPLDLRVHVNRPAGRPGLLWAEVIVLNREAQALRGVRLTVESLDGAPAAFDVTADVFSEAPLDGPVEVGGIGPHGAARVALGLPADGASLRLALRIDALPTRFTAVASSPMALTTDDAELWVAYADADRVVALDTGAPARLGHVDVPGGPTGLALTPDDAQVLVVARDANRLTVIDRATREVLQTFGEADGIGRDPRHVAVSPDGTHAYVTAYVGDTLTRLVRRGDRWSIDGTLPLGRRPVGFSISPDARTITIAHFLPRGLIRRNEAWITLVDAEPFAVRREVPLVDEFNVDRVACLADIFGVHPSRMTSEGVSSQLAGVFPTPGGAAAMVPGMRISPTPVTETGPEAMATVFTNQPRGRFAPAFVFHLDSRVPAEAKWAASGGVLQPPDVNVAYARCAELHRETEFTSRIVLEGGDRQVNLGPALPLGSAGLSETGVGRVVGYTLGGRLAMVLSYVADELALLDGTTQHPITQTHLMLPGSNPIGLAVERAGARAYVLYENSTFVSVLDLAAYADPRALPEPVFQPTEYAQIPEFGPGQAALTNRRLVRHIDGIDPAPRVDVTGRIPLVDEDPMPAELRAGRRLFSSSNPDKYPELSTSRQAACATCHPDGGHDGSVWATVEGERRTLSLRGGVAGRGWLHASGTHRDLHEFLGLVVPQRLGGALDAQTEARLTAWIADGIPRLQTPPVDEALAARGAEVFASACAACHFGDALGSGQPDPADPLGAGLESGPLLFDVGTATDSAGVLLGTFFESIFPPLEAELFALLRGDRALGPDDRAGEILDFAARPARPRGQFKAPSLVNVYDNVVFMHDGRFERLEDVVEHLDGQLGLGLSADDRRAVVEYLRTL